VSDTTGRATATSNHKLPFLNKNKKSKPGHLASSIWNETENQKQKLKLNGTLSGPCILT